MKKLLAVLLAMCAVIGTVTAYAEEKQVSVVLDGTEIIFPDAQPFIDVRDRTLVPVRFVSEALGAEVSWDGDKQTAVIKNGRDTITYTINEYKGYRNNRLILLDTYGILKEDRTFVPLRFISELLDCKVNWQEETQTVEVTSPEEAIDFPEPKITVNYPGSEGDKRLFWITVDNYRDFERNCPNYEFKVDFISPQEFNTFEQNEGAIIGWQMYSRNHFSKPVSNESDIFTVSRGYYSTRENMKNFSPYDGMNMKFTVTVIRKCSGEERVYTYDEVMKLPYPLVNVGE